MHAYPENLEVFVREHWTRELAAAAPFRSFIDEPGAADPLPSSNTLQLLLSTCYQASLMREEDRPVLFRVMLREPGRFAGESGPPEGLHRMTFAQPRPFSANELRRLSPAAGFERALIGLRLNSRGQPEIWGLIHSGTDWIRALEGSRRGFSNLPSSLVIAASGPGRLTVARGSFTIVRLQSGRLALPSVSFLETERELAESKAAREEIIASHESARARAGRPWALLDSRFPRQLQQQLGLRMISAIRSARHGGTILLLRRELALDRDTLQRYVRIKYPFQTGEPQVRARTLMLRAMNLLAESCGETHPPPRTAGWKEYVCATDPRIAATDDAMTELTRFTASLAMVDGAVVLTHALEAIGFGAEISGELPEVEMVGRVIDPETQEVEFEPATLMGTRHRSAYRFCKALPGSVALVVSQDSGLRVVSCLNNQVMCWEQLSAGVFDI
ncbi:MAG: hypothetical protein KJ072_16240 [Verrucomicrobia bacterium]|nr:hypothetical protein [Verrucomicrobiota bacterium]